MPGPGDLDEFRASWVVSLRARNIAPTTIKTYLISLDLLAAHHGPGVPDRAGVEAFLGDLGERVSPSTVSIRFRALRQFYKWLAAEEDIPDPMAGMTGPIAPEQPVPVVTTEQMETLLATCDGNGFTDRRDQALIRLFADSGPRLSEVAGLAVRDVDVTGQTVTVLGKGRRERALPFGAKTAVALDRYKRARGRHPLAGVPEFWLGERGRVLSANGIHQALKRRGAMAGLPDLHAHQLRHSFAHEWLSAGGNEGDLMALAGWRSRSMLQRYGASAAAARAREAHQRLGLGDRY